MLAGAVLLPVLGSCAWFEDEAPPSPLACPAAAALEGADRKTAFAPGRERNARSIRWVAAINQVQARCRMVDGRPELEVRFAVVAEAGPAFEGEPVVLDLFIAALGPDRRIRSKRRLAVRLDPEAAGGRAGQLESLTFELPAPESTRSAGRIYVGFQLDRPEIQERMRRLR